jgi:tetratricopeptide (TPR) repeat protein
MNPPPPASAPCPLNTVSAPRLLSRLFLAIALPLILCTASACAEQTPDAAHLPAWHALMEGRVQDAESLLRTAIAANPADSYSHQLLCRVYYAQDMTDPSIQECQLAAAATTANREEASDNQLWLGRAYGMKARRAGPIAGFKLARQVQAGISRAVDLNPNNVAALNDLGEYDVDAPFIVGGGTDKAQLLVTRMMPRFPAAAHKLLARIADAGNDLPTAEAEFKRAVAAGGTPEAWVDLALFYQSRNRPDDALTAIRSAIAADHSHGPALVDAATILTKAHRAPDLAERCLRDYLASHAKSDAAPAFKVHLKLARLLTARGASVDAARETDAAAALAPAYVRNYHPEPQGGA